MNKEFRKSLFVKELYKIGITRDGLYRKDSIESILLKLQSFIVNTVFENVHGKNLRIIDVANHIQNRASELGINSNKSIIDFSNSCKKLQNLISSEITGNIGEKALRRADSFVYSQHNSIYNVSLKNDDISAELDGIVITNRAIFLLESKYSKNNLFIAENGLLIDKYRSDRQALKNIGDQINREVHVLKSTLSNIDITNDIVIKPYVVATNDFSSLKSNYQYVSTCGISELPHIIDDYPGEVLYTQGDIALIKKAILSSSKEQLYPINFDFYQFIYLFADVLDLIEVDQIYETPDKTIIVEPAEEKNWGTYALGGIAVVGALCLVLFGKQKALKFL
ncbi:Nuclease-related domain-containing protein [Pseudobutyrivibrio sp. ACV-2]|uniref:nuclease-related domain-containing protein n=1 Tax=Pseudobutyrivibrio sp. ACV-2 TaxID=1520801 RepID=UPI00089CF701|nr:nuclease-related domain-containing protein [Pseudobutyrivibrio sp. ACV-2]SEA97214.1 Nuclease-related domain-containing protein [Pseudobutyrivibrio sp. ACV-2]